MITLAKHLFLNNKIIKICSLIIGYSMWAYLGQIYQVSKWVTVPICYYNVPEDTEIKANQEKLSIHIMGKREDIRQCSDIGLHIDGAGLSDGQQYIIPNEELLFLPKTVKMVHYKPLQIQITVSKKDNAHPQGTA